MIPPVNSQVTQEFSTAAFRVGHSQVSNNQQGIDNNGNVTFMQTLGDLFGNTPSQDVANGINSLLRDLSNDNSQAVDVYAVDGLRNLLADSPDQMDLIAIDIQRERDLGQGTLNQTRETLGLTPYTSFHQLTSDPTVAQTYRRPMAASTMLICSSVVWQKITRPAQMLAKPFKQSSPISLMRWKAAIVSFG